MKTILLTKNKTSLIDDRDFELINQWRWCFGGKGYAMRMSRKSDNLVKRKSIYLHKVIMGERKGAEVDHINGNPLDNRRQNLRFVTRSVNQQNRVKTPRFNKERNKWEIKIRFGKGKRLQKRFSSYGEAIEGIKYFTLKLQGIEARV